MFQELRGSFRDRVKSDGGEYARFWVCDLRKLKSRGDCKKAFTACKCKMRREPPHEIMLRLRLGIQPYGGNSISEDAEAHSTSHSTSNGCSEIFLCLSYILLSSIRNANILCFECQGSLSPSAKYDLGVSSASQSEVAYLIFQ